MKVDCFWSIVFGRINMTKRRLKMAKMRPEMGKMRPAECAGKHTDDALLTSFARHE